MYNASATRYDNMKYNRTGKSGLLLPAISLGLWHNFGGNDLFENGRAMVRRAFDLGITHFDLANNYGPPAGSAEESFGQILKKDLTPYRDEMVISTKAGYYMWAGPYGEWGSKKYLVSSLDQSLKRMGLDYVDIFITTAQIQIHHWKKPWLRWTSWYAKVKRFMSGFRITDLNKHAKRHKFCVDLARHA